MSFCNIILTQIGEKGDLSDGRPGRGGWSSLPLLFLNRQVLFLLMGILTLSALNASAQTEEQRSLYMFNPLLFNQGYAGSCGSIHGVGIARFRWVGIEGAPRNQFQRVDMALVTIKNKTGGDTLQVTADPSGTFYVPLNKERECGLLAPKPKCSLVKPISVSTKGLTESKSLSAELMLMPNRSNIPGKKLKNYIYTTILDVSYSGRGPSSSRPLILTTKTRQKIKEDNSLKCRNAKMYT